MMTPTFRKTLLALAVTGAALPAYAQTLTLTDSGLVKESQAYSETVVVNGSFSGSNGNDAIEFNSVEFAKDLIVDATVNAAGSFVAGLDLSAFEDDEDGYVQGEPTRIAGDLINKGSLNATGGSWASAIMLEPAEIAGDLINEGSLNAKATQFAQGLDISSDGMAVGIGGSIINRGQISVEAGEYAEGIAIYQGIEVGGDIVNEKGATITATSMQSADGISLSDMRLHGKLINHGEIRVSSPGADAIDLDMDSALAGVVNTGLLQASGAESTGIQLDGGEVGLAGIRNSGTIKAEGTALRLEEFTLGQDARDAQENYLKVRQEGGLIEGGVAAIDGRDYWGNANKIDLLWSGGTIRGDILGIGGLVEVRGAVEFDGERIEVGEWLDVGSVSGQDNGGVPFIGHLELAKPHTTIDGNLYVAGNSSLGLSLSSATDPDKAVLSVTKEAEFGDGARLILQAKGDDFSADGSQYRLVEATKITNEGLQVVSSSQLLKVSELQITSTGISGGLASIGTGGTDDAGTGGDTGGTDDSGSSGGDTGSGDTGSVGGESGSVVVEVKDADEFRATIASGGGNSNAQAAGAAFVGIASKLASSDPLLKAFDGISEAQAAQVAAQLAPEVNGGATQAALTGQSLVSGVAAGRTGAARGMSSGDSFQQAGIWVQGLYSDANQDLRDGVAGYDARSRGIAVGADGKLNDQLTLGLAYSFLNTDVNSDGGNKTEVDGHAFTLYGGYELGNYFVDASLTYGVSDNSSKRYIAGTTAKGDYDSSLLGLNLVGGYGIQLDNGLLVEPRVAARYSNVKIDSYSEKGSSAALKVGAQRYEVAELGAGVRLAGSFAAGQGTLEPQAKLMAYHDLVADRASSTSTFVLGSTPFVTSGAKPVRNSYEAGVGVDYRLGAVTLGVSYDYIGKTGFDADTVQAKLRYDF